MRCMKSKSRQEGVRGRQTSEEARQTVDELLDGQSPTGGSELFTTGSSRGAHTAGWSAGV